MRRRRPEKRKILPDPIYNDLEVAKFMNYLMFGGKKGISEQIFYGAMDTIKSRTKNDGVEIFKLALKNTGPTLEVKTRRIGGANYQVPMPVNARRRQSLTFRWIITACRAEKGKPFAQCLAKEIWDASKGEGKAVTTREQTHRMAEANKAFAHFAF